MSDEQQRPLTRSEFIEWMTPSFTAMLIKTGKKPRGDVLAAIVYDELELCGVTLLRGPGAKAHSAPGHGERAWKLRTRGRDADHG